MNKDGRDNGENRYNGKEREKILGEVLKLGADGASDSDYHPHRGGDVRRFGTLVSGGPRSCKT